MSRIFLAGAAGVIGRRLTPILVAHGHSVWGATRSPDKSEFLRELGARPVLVDVFDAEVIFPPRCRNAARSSVFALSADNQPRQFEEKNHAVPVAASHGRKGDAGGVA
jgi:nucleoside-diphosphate-sugar epimerase